MFKAAWNDPYAQRNGRTGQEQHGVDIFGRQDQGETWDGIQVKGKHGFFGQAISEQELRAEAQKAQMFVPRLKNFIMVTSARRDQVIQQIARRITEENLPLRLFSVSVLGWDDIEERLAEFPDVIREHYPQFTLGTAGTAALDRNVAGQLAKVQELIRTLSELSGGVDRSLVTRTVPAPDYPPLNPASYASRQGTLNEIITALESNSWVALIASTGMGKTLLARSIWESKSEDARYWITFSGQEGRYQHHLDLQVLGALVRATGDESLLERFHSGRLRGMEITEQTGILVTKGALLVLDDLPNLAENEILRERLSSFAFALWDA